MTYNQIYDMGFRAEAEKWGVRLQKEAGFWSNALGTAKALYGAIQEVKGDNFMEKAKNTATGLSTMARVGNWLNDAKSYVSDLGGKMSNFWNGLSPDVQRALITSLATGAVPMLFGSGSFTDRLKNSLLYGAAGGAGMYGLSRTGYYDKIKGNLNKAKQYLTDQIQQNAGNGLDAEAQ